MTTGQNNMAASSTCAVDESQAGPGLGKRSCANKLDAHHRMFGIGQVAEAGALRALEIFRHVAAAIPADQTRYRRVGVDDHKRQAAACQQPSDRSGETDEVGDVAAI